MPESSQKDWARPVVHWDIRARDPQLLKEFYSKLFNWDIGGPLMDIAPGIGGPEEGVGGNLLPSDRTGVTLYVQVRDLKQSLTRSVELGGSLVGEPFDVPGGPTLGGIADPEGNLVMLVQQ